MVYCSETIDVTPVTEIDLTKVKIMNSTDESFPPITISYGLFGRRCTASFNDLVGVPKRLLASCNREPVVEMA